MGTAWYQSMLAGGRARLASYKCVHFSAIESRKLSAEDWEPKKFRTASGVNQSRTPRLLTGLHNRGRGVERLVDQVALAQRHSRQLAVLYLDLDQFKHVNDRWGHYGGDRLLHDLGRRLARQVRAEDSLCRLAADEFMLVLPEVGQDPRLADLASLCERLLARVAEPFDLDGHQVQVHLSLGVALYPRDGSDGETLMRHADTALHAAKRAGRQTYRFFEPSMNAALARFIQTRDALDDALERQAFVLHYPGFDYSEQVTS